MKPVEAWNLRQAVGWIVLRDRAVVADLSEQEDDDDLTNIDLIMAAYRAGRTSAVLPAVDELTKAICAGRLDVLLPSPETGELVPRSGHWPVYTVNLDENALVPVPLAERRGLRPLWAFLSADEVVGMWPADAEAA